MLIRWENNCGGLLDVSGVAYSRDAGDTLLSGEQTVTSKINVRTEVEG